jgi:predicted nucleic acid-binding protein
MGGLIERLPTSSATYLDTNVLIYAFEGRSVFAEAVRGIASAIDEGTRSFLTSELTLAELLVDPLRKGDPARARVYRQYLRTRPHFEVVPVSRAVLVEAARLRGATSLKLPDAMHVATALVHGCGAFLTNDARIRAPERATLQVVQLSEV